MKNTYIIDAKRTPIGKFGGALNTVTATELMSVIIRSLNIGRIDQVIIGNTLSAGLGQNPARIASYQAGVGVEIPAYTVNLVCGSGLQSIILAQQLIQDGQADLIIAGGMESMSNVPYYLDNYRLGVKIGNQSVRDGLIFDGLYCSLSHQHMGVTAENLARRYKISRAQQDLFALLSHQKSVKALVTGKFQEEIIPITTSSNGTSLTLQNDENPRGDTSLEALARLKTAFRKEGSVTAGNSSPLSDGAAGVLVASENAIRRYDLKPKLLIKSYALVGLDPKFMGMGASHAAKKVLKGAKLKKESIDVWEINEAFAAQSLAVINDLGINPDLVNMNGGAIALGHPLGASGSRIMTTLLHQLKRSHAKLGLAALCIGGGQGIAMVVESIN